MANINKIDPALLKSLEERGALIRDIKGQVDLDASIEKLRQIKSRVSQPVSQSGLVKNTTVLRPGPTVALASLPKDEKVTFSSDPSQQKLSPYAAAQQVINKKNTTTEQITLGDIISRTNPIGIINPKIANEFVTELARAPVKAMISTGLGATSGVLELATGKKVEDLYTPNTKVEKMLFGAEPIKGVFKKTDEAVNWIENKLKSIGVNQNSAKLLALQMSPLFVAASTGIDLTPFGGEKKTAEQIAKTKNVEKIYELIKPMFKTHSEDDVFRIAASLVEETNPKVIKEKLLEHISQLPNAGLSEKEKAIKRITVKPAEYIINNVLPKINEIKNNVTPSEKQRKFIKTLLDSESTPLPLKEKLAKLPDANYNPIKNEEVFKEAADFVNKNYQEALDYFNNTTKIDARFNAVGQILAKQSAEAGRYEEAIDIVEKLAKVGTEEGQFIQAFKAWDNLTPEGMLYFAKREIEKANKATGQIKKMIDKLLKREELSLDEETAKLIVEKMKSLKDVTDNEGRAKIIHEVFEILNEKIPISVSEIFDAYRYQNMLSSPRTQLRNIYFNLFQAFVTEPLKMVAETPIDWIITTLTGKERERYLKDIPVYYRNLINSFGDGIEAFKETWRGKQINLTNPDFEKFRMDKLPKGVTIVSRFMEGADQFLRAMVYSGIKAVKLSHGVSEEQAIKKATKISNYLLFKNRTDAKNITGQGIVLSKIDQITNAINSFGKIMPGMRWFVPFINVPMRVAKQWIEFSPAGLTTLIGNKNKTEQIAKTLIGSLITLYGAKLSLDNNTTWSAPKNEKDKKLFYASGRRPYSVKIGNAWVPMIYFGPFALALAIPAAIKYHFQDSPEALTDSKIEKIAKVITSSAELFSQQTFMEGLGKYIDLISGNADYNFSGALAFTAGQVIPFQSLDRYLATIIDPTYRKATNFKENLMKDMPFVSKKLPPLESIGGEIAMREWYNYLLPFDILKHQDNWESIIQKRKEAAQQRSVLSEEEKQKKQELTNYAMQLRAMDEKTRNKKLLDFLEERGLDDYKELFDIVTQSKDLASLEDDFYKSLEVKSGLRTIFVKKAMDELKTDQERLDFGIELVKKKILTREVFEQLTQMIEEEKENKTLNKAPTENPIIGETGYKDLIFINPINKKQEILPADRINAYTPLIEKIANELNYPVDLAWGQLVYESRLNPNAVSSAGAKSLAQITESTYKSYQTSPGQHESIKKYFDIDKYSYDDVIKDPELQIRFMIAKIKADEDRGIKDGIQNYNSKEKDYSKNVRDFSKLYNELKK